MVVLPPWLWQAARAEASDPEATLADLKRQIEELRMWDDEPTYDRDTGEVGFLGRTRNVVQHHGSVLAALQAALDDEKQVLEEKGAKPSAPSPPPASGPPPPRQPDRQNE